MISKASLFLICLQLGGCMFIDLNEDVKQLEAAVSIRGTIAKTVDNSTPIVVTLSRSQNGKNTLHDYTVIYGSGEFLMLVPEGKYYLLAFEDTNQDFTLQATERVGWYGSPSLIEATAGRKFSNFIIELKRPELAKKELPILFEPGTNHKPVNLDNGNIGEVVDASVFKAELGSLGMWNPLKFHLQGYSGIFFLEPYDEEKLPVLFVHGISGSGYDWMYLVDQLDREKVQPWIVQYPSGMRLELISKFLSQSINELKATWNFEKISVVAHSMGGLVARGFINHQSALSNSIPTFVTISTPWLGHESLQHGPKFVPVAVPSWFDMVPGSPFIRAVSAQPLPQNTSFHLMFGHNADAAGLFGRSSSDGSVSLRSQLPLGIQEEAETIKGYDMDHVGILKSFEVAKALNKILTESSR